MQIKITSALALIGFATATSAAAIASPATGVLPPLPFAIVNLYAVKNCSGPTTAYKNEKGTSGCYNFKGQSIEARGYNCNITAWTGPNCKGRVGDGISQDLTCIDFPYQSVEVHC